MNNEDFDKLLDEALFIECTEDTLILEQEKDRRGVCIITEEQSDAAEKIIQIMGRKVEEISGSKRGNLEYRFSPPLTEEEWENIFLSDGINGGKVMSNETNPIIFFCSCEDCGAKAGEECNDSCYKNSRLNHFIECAPLRDRMRAMSWLYLTLPQWLKKDTMDEGPKSGTLYLSREEFMIWKKLNAAGVAK